MLTDELPAAIARWIVAATDHATWNPALPPFGDVSSFRWNGRELAGATMRMVDGHVVIEASASPADELDPRAERPSMMSVRFVNGGTLDSSDSYISGHRTNIDAIAKTMRRTFQFTALTWRWRASADAAQPTVWFATVQGRFHGLFNVETRTAGNPSFASGLWLEGAVHRYFLTAGHEEQSSERSFGMLIFPAQRMSLSALAADHRVLEFCLGSPLRSDYVLGFDEENRVIEVQGAPIGETHRRGERTAPAVPLAGSVSGIRGNWIAPMFAKLSKALAEKPDLFTPLAHYVSSIGRFIDSEFLSLQVALEALASKLLESAPTRPRSAVKDEDAWKKWVDEHRNEIADHALPGTVESLIGRMKSLWRPSTSNASREAFRLHGVELLKEHKDVVRGRDVVAHTALMNADGTYDFLREMRRICIVRSLLVALISLSIGYRGQIRGWQTPDRDDPEPAPPEWWPVSEEDQRAATAWFIASVPS